MTIKTIIKLSCDESIAIMREINWIQANMCFKTKYEQKTARVEIKQLAKKLQALLSGTPSGANQERRKP